MPTTSEKAPGCLANCQAVLDTCNAKCQGGPEGAACRDECLNLFYATCVDACPAATDPACLTAPYTDCYKTCTLVDGSCHGSGIVCGSNGECCSGKCTSTCPGGLGGIFCNDPSYCD